MRTVSALAAFLVAVSGTSGSGLGYEHTGKGRDQVDLVCEDSREDLNVDTGYSYERTLP